MCNKMKQLRIDFPDYPAEEQEKDIKRLKLIRHAYLMKVDGEWAHLIIGQNEDRHYYGKKNLTEVYHELKENFPNHKPIVIRNEGLENYLRDMKPKPKVKELTIPFERD